MDYETVYDASRLPELNRLRPAPYIAIDAEVAVGSQELWNALQVLLKLSEMVKSDRRDAGGYRRDELYPLEGVREVSEAEDLDFEERIRPGKILMRQPDDLTPARFAETGRDFARTVAEPLRQYLDAARLAIVDEGPSVQIRHFGPYGDEPASFAVIDRFLGEHHLRRTSPTTHREIYLVDVRSAPPEGFETVLGMQVEHAQLARDAAVVRSPRRSRSSPCRAGSLLSSRGHAGVNRPSGTATPQS